MHIMDWQGFRRFPSCFYFFMTFLAWRRCWGSLVHDYWDGLD
jgi:hypothetical protein